MENDILDYFMKRHPVHCYYMLKLKLERGYLPVHIKTIEDAMIYQMELESCGLTEDYLI